MAFQFDSVTDVAGYRTRFVIDTTNSTFQSLQLFNGANKVFEFPTLQAPLCVIQFQRYDLQANALLKKDANGEFKVQDVVNYTPTNATANGNKLQYTAVLGQAFIGSGIAPVTFGAINVELAFSAANQTAEDFGWIDIDVAFTMPPEFSDPAFTDKQGWRINLIVPQIQFDVSGQASAVADNTNLKDWSVLLPNGDLGKVADLETQGLTKDSPLLVQGMPVQYAALYKTAANYIRGIAFSATDVLGGEKSFFYSRPEPANPLADFLHCYTVFPIHLSGTRYVRPLLSDEPQYHFRLSKGDENGFGGGRMHYRIKAFHIDQPVAGAMLDWRDVANIYRKWVKANRSVWFNKANARVKNGPMDTMSPFTVIANYGLDGPIDPAVFDAKLPGKWLEIHPVKVDGQTDMPASRTQTVNDNESLQKMLKRIRQAVATSEADPVKLEAQIWGYELGGYYHYIGGYPPITNILHAATAATPDRFKKAMNELVNANIIPVFTSDFFRQLFNGGRFAGHILWTGTNWAQIGNSNTWNEAITHPFPAAYTDPARNPNPCKFQVKTRFFPDPASPSNFKDLTRVFIVKKQVDAQGRDFFSPQPNCPEAETLAASQLFDEKGPAPLDGLLTRPFYQRAGRAICPTEEALSSYLNLQVSGGALKHGARLLEFMKARYNGCYSKAHRHIFEPVNSSFYTNAIGPGAYATARRRQIFSEIQARARVNNPSFALSHENATIEPLLPFYEEFYHSSPVFHFVYSEVISAKMTLAGVEPYIHPGYKEKRKLINGQPPTTLARPDEMLRPQAEDDPVPAPLVIKPKAPMPDPNGDRTASFKAWRNICINYFDQFFQVDQYGIAPKSYPTGALEQGRPVAPWNANNPMAKTNPPTFTYIRCVQDLFNLRYWIYATGEKAVIGERVQLHANWFEEPLDYNDEVVRMAVRAAQLQVRFAGFFRGGVMIGRTAITRGNKALWAWRATYRYFDDVKPLTDKTGTPEVLDFISLGTDKEYLDAKKIMASVVSYDKIQHMVWQTGSGDSRKLLYVFANVGNAAANVRFLYSRGMEGISSNQAAASGWEKVVTSYTNAGVTQTTAPVWLNFEETGLTMPPRTFIANEIRKINHAQFISQSVPVTMNAGTQHTVTIRMKNTGSSTWSDSTQHRLGSQNPRDNLTWGTGRVGIGATPVPPGQEKTFQFTVKAPTAPGIYNFQWQMLRESVEWFGDQTQNFVVRVV
jgi:hypothetical protein